MFVLQAAVVKEGGGIATAVAHYERMCRAVGVRSAVIFKGPALERLRAEGSDAIEAPALLSSPLGASLPVLGDLRREILRRAAGDEIVAVVHSDRTLGALQRLLPEARFITPCHSDKFKHKHSADLVVALNAEQERLARQALPRTPVALLGNPYVAPPPRQLAAGQQARLNFVARFTPTKNPLLLLAAAARLSSPPPIRMIGAGELEGAVREAAAALRSPVELPGWIEAPFSQFHDRDILVLPSLWEGLPYLLQEALAHGVPVIASDIAGNRAALGDGAYGALFAAGDEAALAAAIEAAVGDLDALKVKAEKGRAALHERYGAAAFWSRFTDALQHASEHSHV